MGISILFRCLFSPARITLLGATLLHREICNSLRLLQIDRIVSDAPDPVECALASPSMALCQIFRWIWICSCLEACRDKRPSEPSWIYRTLPRHIEHGLRNSGSHSYRFTSKQYKIANSQIVVSIKVERRVKKNTNQKILFKCDVNDCTQRP